MKAQSSTSVTMIARYKDKKRKVSYMLRCPSKVFVYAHALVVLAAMLLCWLGWH